MRLRPAGSEVRRRLVLIGVLAVAAAGCADPPTRQQTDVDLLVELHGARRVTVTLAANDVGYFSPVARPRGGPRTTTTTAHALTAEEVARIRTELLAPRRSPDIATEVPDARAALGAVGRALTPGTVLVDTRVVHHRYVGTLRFGTPLRTPLRVRPGALVRALDHGGLSRDDTVWVGVCVPATDGEWTHTPQAFDRSRGCVGWVPDRRAHTVGVLVSGSQPSSTAWPVVGLTVAALALAAVCGARLRAGRRSWNAPVVLVAIVVALGASAACVHVRDTIGDLHETFATHVDDAVAHEAGSLAPAGAFLALTGIGVLVWCASDPERRRRRAGDQPPKRSLRGSSV